jgi:hypothetical protein
MNAAHECQHGVSLEATGSSVDVAGLSRQRISITPRGPKRSAGRHRKPHESKGAQNPKSKAERTASPAALRPGSKQALLVDLLRRKGGATIAELVKAAVYLAAAICYWL